jgi:hypothetical protein
MTKFVGLLPLLVSFAACAQQTVQLPHVFRDEFGSNWDVQYDGSIGDGGNDLYDGGGRLFINNNAQYQAPNGQATFDAARNELTFPPIAIGTVNVSRRVAHLPALGAIRFTEVLENPTAAPVRVQLRCYFNMGGSVQAAIPLNDERHPKQPLCGYAIGDQNNAVAMIAAGRGAKLTPRFNYRQNDDNVDIFYDVDVPAKQTVAVVHVQLRRRTADQAADAWRELKDKEILRDLPKDLRRRLVNFPGGDAFIGDLEILRGDALDIVELRGGDTYRGTLKIDHFRLQTLYGTIRLTPDKVVSLLNVGRFRPSQLIVTSEGEVFGGRLDVESIKLQLSGGQVTTIPLSQVTRLGYRRRPGGADADEWNFENKSVAYLRSGERIRVRTPAVPFNLATPSGPIQLNPAVVSSIVFQGEENNVPEVHLVDGTKLSALLSASTFEMPLVGLGGPTEQRALLPAAAMLRFNFNPEQETDHLTPTMTLSNQDTLVGVIGGTLSLETPFDTIHVEGDQIKALEHSKGAGGGDHDVQITLWDDSTLSGRLVESHVTCRLRCGVSIRVPIALVDGYEQPLPVPSPAMVERIKLVAKDLDSDEWTVRDRAQSQILAIGPPVLSVLKQLQPKAPDEAAQRIELIINRLARQLEHPQGEPTPPDSNGGAIDVFR